MKLQPVAVAFTVVLPSGERVPLSQTPGGSLWAAVHGGVLYFRFEYGVVPTAADADRWLALVGQDEWGSRHGPIF